MENLPTNIQSDRYLDLLLQHVACPIDNSISLTAIRNLDGEIVALKSKDKEYPVVNNVPRLIPDTEGIKRRDVTVWHRQQDTTVQEFQSKGADAYTRTDHEIGRAVGKIMAQTGNGLFLDVGCGPVRLPGYMDASSDSILWMGIDPLFDDIARQFPFAQALGEYLPFQPQVFDGVLYGYVLDHLADPLRSLERVRSIIKPQGKLYVWHDRRRVNLRYILWKTMRMLGFSRLYNEYFQWAFTRKSLQALLKSAGFAVEKEIWLCKDYCSDYATCDEPVEFLTVARCI